MSSCGSYRPKTKAPPCGGRPEVTGRVSRRNWPLGSGPGCRRFCRNRCGATAVEFAIVGPVLMLLLIGIMIYGGYFLMAHSVQELANDAARSAVAGLSDSERQQLASASLASELPSYGFLNPKQVQLNYSDQAQVMTIHIAYDASASPLWP